ncbi:uncharacterized protein N7515_003924 [Penicillium bovifimosum]|uniref:Xylanolytic transcriptional activator regulatory domain-containing protein n=1 Tax=Penicillium bovifimosum TaxID=126998 RepID=A0A9W9H617_9EURO|nr:uncharacterized protein N7515_003924 [Penicillium bovifimosum]KAJ5139076.1 hypothetical protein N7515_003924 [Penicillium bovifimosum]
MDPENTSTGSSSVIRRDTRDRISIAKRACDQCKFRKIKVRYSPHTKRYCLSQPCKSCQSMGFECTFIQPQKKRGPTGHRVSQIRQQQTLATPQASSPDAFQFQPPTMESGQVASLPGAPWTPTRDSTMSHEPEELPNTGPPPAMPAAWGAYTESIYVPPNFPMGLDDRHEVEYWLPDNLDSQVPVFGFPGSNFYLKPSLPSIIQPVPDISMGMPQHAQNMPFSPVGSHSETQGTPIVWPVAINEANMIPWIDVYFDRLHPTIPVLNRSALYTSMLTQEHRRNPQFGAMLLSLCAFSLTQPIEIDERPTTSSRASQARAMMQEATKMRSCSDFGENPTIEAVLTSFFLFGCLFGTNQHNAAWLRLREALDLAATLRLNDPESYRHLSGEEKGQRLRTYLVLSITERAYALQRRHPITFWGKPGFSIRSVHDFIHSATHSVISGIIVHNEKDAEGMMGLARMMELFDAIDEEVIDCWNLRCPLNSDDSCKRLTKEKALSIHQNLSRVDQAERYRGYDWFERAKGGSETSHVTPAMGLRETQAADVFITQKWLQNRVWLLCSSHEIIKTDAEPAELNFRYAVTIAESTLQLCKSLRLSSMEAHGIGLAEKLYDIATCATNILCNMRPPYGDACWLDHEVIRGSSTSTPQSLAEDFLLLMTSFRGGNHPYLEKYRDHLRSLQIM